MPGGMGGFTLVWIGQLVSVLASNMSSFAPTIWVCQETGSATTLGIISACFTVPFLLVSPIAGAMVDRYDHGAEGASRPGQRDDDARRVGPRGVLADPRRPAAPRDRPHGHSAIDVATFFVAAGGEAGKEQ